MKYITKPGFDIDTIRNRYNKHYKKLKQSGKETDKVNFKYAKVSFKKIIDNKKKRFEKNSGEL